MMNTKFLVSIFLLFLVQSFYSQSSIDLTIKAEAEQLAQATLEGDYNLLVEYTHPNVIKNSGGKEKLLQAITSQVEGMLSNGASFDSFEIGNPVETQLYRGSYQTLVPKTMKMTVNGQKIIANEYLFGFGDKDGKNWVFVEAHVLNTERGKQFFPDFKTNIEIPEREQPIIIDEKGLEKVLEFDENAGTYDSAYEKSAKIGFVIGQVLFFLFLVVVLIGIVFLVLYLVKRGRKVNDIKKEKVYSAETKKSIFSKIEKINCKQCEAENSSDSKYCKFCGYNL